MDASDFIMVDGRVYLAWTCSVNSGHEWGILLESHFRWPGKFSHVPCSLNPAKGWVYKEIAVKRKGDVFHFSLVWTLSNEKSRDLGSFIQSMKLQVLSSEQPAFWSCLIRPSIFTQVSFSAPDSVTSGHPVPISHQSSVTALWIWVSTFDFQLSIPQLFNLRQVM